MSDVRSTSAQTEPPSSETPASAEWSFERNCLSYWFPRIEAAGLPVPRTTILRPEGDLTAMLDGVKPDGWDEFHALVQAACYDVGVPCFLRTGQGSGKHSWAETCFVADAEKVGQHIFNLVEWSHLVDMMGIPHDVWAVRELLPTSVLFRCPRFDGFPVTREFRYFVRGGVVEHVQPYWPPGAVEEGAPDAVGWREILADANALMPAEASYLGDLAVEAVAACGGGYWSVDFLDSPAGWFLTDMALGDRSFKWSADAASEPPPSASKAAAGGSTA